MPLLLSAQFRSGMSYEDLDDSETVAAIKSHVRTLSAAHLEGRKAGSEGEKEAAEYVEQMFRQYKDIPLLASLRLVDGENINVDLIHQELRKQAQNGTATISLPIIGPVTFGPADVEKLFQYIRG